MIPNLAGALANRKKFIDEVSEIGTGTGYGSGSGAGASGSKFNAFNFTAKSATGLTGLQNQGATCYLNSLLQALYHCNEFRAAIYRFEYDASLHGPEERCLTRQLQRLFAMLQLSDRGAVPTTLLTSSFGWSSADSFQQQDIQECMSVIFEHIQCNSDRNLSNFFATMWSGKYHDGLRCQNCQQSRGQSILFRDIQVPVRGQGDIYAALQSFFDSEVLDGVLCDVCNGRFPHSKGFQLQSLPYFLSLQLKRFDINWDNMQRVKVHDKLSFPSCLDMSRFLPAAAAGNNPEENIYDLLAVLVHSGGAHAGHYLCYVRDWRGDMVTPQETWNCFNDSTVIPLQDKDIQDCLGFSSDSISPVIPESPKESSVSSGPLKPPTKLTASGSNAYMLLYRKRGAQNLNSVPAELIPASLRENIKSDNIQYNKAKAEWEYEQAFLRLSVKYDNLMLNVVIHETSTIHQLVDMVHAAIVEQAQRQQAAFDDKDIAAKPRLPSAVGKGGNGPIMIPNKENMRFRIFDSIRGVLLGHLGQGDHSQVLASLTKADISRPLHVDISSQSTAADADECVPFNVIRFHQIGEQEPTFSVPVSLLAPPTYTLLQLVSFIADRVGGTDSPSSPNCVCCTVNEVSGAATQLQPVSSATIGDGQMAGETIYVDFDSSAGVDGLEPRLLKYFNDFWNQVTVPIRFLQKAVAEEYVANGM
jgi:ubiquitin C-terminal hydrolase